MAGNGLNIGGTAVRAAGIDGQFATNLLGAWGTWIQGKLRASQLKAQASGYGAEASGQMADAHAAIRQAGDEQRAGMDQAANRYLVLGQDVGRIYAGAAAGNIEASSRSVGRVESAARMMAGRDVAAIAATTKSRTDALHSQSVTARANAVRLSAQGDILRAQARYEKKMAQSMMRSQIVSAVGQWMSAHAANASSMIGGMSWQ